MKSARFDRLLASTALVVVLALSSQVGAAQQTENPTTASVPVPDTTLPAPLTAKDIEAPAKQVAPGPTKEEPKQNATTAPTEPTKAATNAAPADAIGEKLRELITGRQFDRLVSRKADRAGIEAYYSSHNYAPLWISNGAANERAKAATAYLGQADAVGLDPNDYPTPDFKSATTADALAEAEIKLTAAVLTFARHAQIGRIHFTRVAADIQFNLVAPEPADVLAKLADGSDAGKVLDSYNPPQAEFKALKAKLAELRSGQARRPRAGGEAGAPRVHVPEGKILRPGMRDARVVALRKRLDIAGDKDNPLYDDAVARRGQDVPDGSRHRRRRQSRPQHRARAQRRERKCASAGRRPDRHHHRQHGALALGAARPRQPLRDGQHSGLHAALCTTTSCTGRPRSWSASRASRRR